MRYKSLFPLTLLFLASCATNPYKRFYSDYLQGEDYSKFPIMIPSTGGEPRLITGSNPESDNQTMWEQNYEIVGSSSFNAGPIDPSEAVSWAKVLRADTVIVYSRYSNTVSGTIPLTLPDTQTSNTSLTGTSYNQYGGFTNFSGNAETTTYGSKTTYIPYSVNRSDYLATYWIRMKSPILGAKVQELTPEKRREIASNKGVEVFAVVRGTPAFGEDIMKGDIIRKINGQDVLDGKDFSEKIVSLAGQKAQLELVRDKKTIKKVITLNQIAQ
jgi:hypothetical protein